MPTAASAGRWVWRFSSTTTCSGYGATSSRPARSRPDLAKHKKTLPLIYALENARPADGRRLRELLAAAELTASEQAEARAILERSGAREYTRNEAHRQRDEAIGRLEAAGIVQGEALERLRLDPGVRHQRVTGAACPPTRVRTQGTLSEVQ